jgi:hypothetical protein
MADKSSRMKWWNKIKHGGRTQVTSDTQDGSQRHLIAATATTSRGVCQTSAIYPSKLKRLADVAPRPENADASTTVAIQGPTDASIPLPAIETPTSSETPPYTSPHNAGASAAARISQHVTSDRAAVAVEPGLHTLFDSGRDGEIPKAAEIEYVPRYAHPRIPSILTNYSTSVVAVHGLNFKGSANHALETWTKGDKLWLKDLLPTSLPKPARVILYAYNSSPAIGAAAIKLDEHANLLLQWLRIERGVNYSSYFHIIIRFWS